MRTEPTEQELRAAFEHHRARRPAEWPEDFEEAMAHPTLSRLVRITAMHPPRTVRKAAPQPPRQRFRFATGAASPIELTGTDRRYFIDRKRAAAGEREDD